MTLMATRHISAMRRIASALMLTTSLTIASAAFLQPAHAQANYQNAFFQSGHTYCDAKLVAAAWGVNVDQGKAIIGRKIVNGIGDDVNRVLAEARQSFACEFTDTPHTYDDAVILARLWGQPSPWEAKLLVAQYYTNGESYTVTETLNDARAQPAPPKRRAAVQEQTGAQQQAAFAQSEFTYCDAKLVAAVWGTTVLKGKAVIGRKILNGIGDDVQRVLVQARQSYACTFEDTPHTYQDAVRLAQAWGSADPYQAKLIVAQLYTDGDSQTVREALSQ
jgi:hypothetical protein